MEDEKKEKVSYFVLEGITTHFSLIIKRLILLCIVILIAWLITIGGFLWYISLPVDEYSTVTVDSEDGNANYIGNDMKGDINNYGESESNSK